MDLKNILVTGAAGYIGTCATNTLLEEGYFVVAIDNFSAGYRQPLEILKKAYPNSLVVIEKDILSDLDSIFLSYSIDAILHFASPCNVDESVKNPKKYFDNIEYGTRNLITYAINHKVQYFIFSSTCAVYGEPVRLPISEDHPTNPINPYGKAKLAAENIVKNSTIKYMIFRYFNVCGTSKDAKFGDSKRPSSALVQNAVRGVMGIEAFSITCQRANTKDGTPVRDFIDVMDLVWAHILGLKFLSNGGNSEIINLGTGRGYSVLEIIERVESITGTSIDKKISNVLRHGEIEKIYASYRKANNVLHWRPKLNISISIRNLIKWYTDNPSGWGY